ncbi:MAG: nucleotidyltransferase domain-containing protein [Desulfuromonadales bacterium]|nr:nucleotidyltransferase domain-containing protein [Desulfuromonadales bacterium]
MIKFKLIDPQTIDRLPAVEKILSEEAGVVFAYLFGGFAAGRPTPLSDVDIAVYFDSKADLARRKLDLFDRLADALGTAELDLVPLNTAPLSLAGRILQNRRILADRNPPFRHAYESLTRREFFDFSRKECDILLRRYAIDG